MMNMQKVGTFIQSKSGSKNEVNTGSNPMNTGFRTIHYANIREGQGGTVSGIVSAFQVWRALSAQVRRSRLSC